MGSAFKKGWVIPPARRGAALVPAASAARRPAVRRSGSAKPNDEESGDGIRVLDDRRSAPGSGPLRAGAEGSRAEGLVGPHLRGPEQPVRQLAGRRAHAARPGLAADAAPARAA